MVQLKSFIIFLRKIKEKHKLKKILSLMCMNGIKMILMLNKINLYSMQSIIYSIILTESTKKE